jgi:rRNA processing protein Krr1/Pno1
MLKGRVFWALTLCIIWRQPSVSEANIAIFRDETRDETNQQKQIARSVTHTWKIIVCIDTKERTFQLRPEKGQLDAELSQKWREVVCMMFMEVNWE